MREPTLAARAEQGRFNGDLIMTNESGFSLGQFISAEEDQKSELQRRTNEESRQCDNWATFLPKILDETLE